MSLVGLLVLVFVACLVIWATRALIAAFSIGPPLSTLLYVGVVLIVAFWALSQLGVGIPGLRL